jgi:hypothetical protein
VWTGDVAALVDTTTGVLDTAPYNSNWAAYGPFRHLGGHAP